MTENSLDYKDLKYKLKKTNNYKQLSDLIHTIILTEARVDYTFMKKNLSHLKKLLCDTVETAWKSSKGTIESSIPQPIRHIRHITSVPKLRANKTSENKLAWSIESIQKNSKSRDEKQVLPDYSHIKGAASFARSIREINKARNPSPGPSCYFFEPLKNKIRSPRIVFPRSVVDRTSYIPVSMSPGPNKYHPSIHNIVKHS